MSVGKRDSEDNPLEARLQENNEWPVKLTGTLEIIDAGSFNGDFAEWAIGEFEVADNGGDILVEFKGKTLKLAGIDLTFEYSDPITLWVNYEIEQYYQVERVLNK